MEMNVNEIIKKIIIIFIIKELNKFDQFKTSEIFKELPLPFLAARVDWVDHAFCAWRVVGSRVGSPI